MNKELDYSDLLKEFFNLNSSVDYFVLDYGEFCSLIYDTPICIREFFKFVGVRETEKLLDNKNVRMTIFSNSVSPPKGVVSAKDLLFQMNNSEYDFEQRYIPLSVFVFRCEQYKRILEVWFALNPFKFRKVYPDLYDLIPDKGNALIWLFDFVMNGGLDKNGN
jgi:hypothetical protein